MHVDDVVAALLAMAASPIDRTAAPTTSAAAPARAWSISRSRSSAIAGGGRVEHVAWPALAEQVETGDFVADISRIERELGWRPAIALRDGLERTVAFYRRLGRGVMQRAGCCISRMRSWLAAPKKWC